MMVSHIDGQNEKTTILHGNDKHSPALSDISCATFVTKSDEIHITFRSRPEIHIRHGH